MAGKIGPAWWKTFDDLDKGDKVQLLNRRKDQKVMGTVREIDLEYGVITVKDEHGKDRSFMMDEWGFILAEGKSVYSADQLKLTKLLAEKLPRLTFVPGAGYTGKNIADIKYAIKAPGEPDPVLMRVILGQGEHSYAVFKHGKVESTVDQGNLTLEEFASEIVREIRKIIPVGEGQARLMKMAGVL